MNYQCPICNIHLTEDDLEQHARLETKKLSGQALTFDEQIAISGPPPAKRSLRSKTKSKPSTNKSPSKRKSPPQNLAFMTEPLKQIKLSMDTIHKHRRDRGYKLIGQRPLRPPVTPPPSSNTQDAVVCPICKESIGPEIVNIHIDQCLNDGGPTESGHHSDSTLDGPMTPLPTPPRRSHFSKHCSDNEDEVDIGCNCSRHGSVQFTELDVMPYSVAIHGPDQIDLAVHSIISGSGARELDPLDVKQELIKRADLAAEQVKHTSSVPLGQPTADANTQLLHVLKERIAYLEQLTAETSRCKVCWDPLGSGHQAPVVSVNCWHIHCQQCWLQSLGCRRVCPQCMKITGPEDLRRVYI